MKKNSHKPDFDTLNIRFSHDGFATVGDYTWFEHVWHQIKENRARKLMPIFQSAPQMKMTHAVIYKEPQGEVKYFDIEAPLVKEGRRWVRFEPLVAFMDLKNESSS